MTDIHASQTGIPSELPERAAREGPGVAKLSAGEAQSDDIVVGAVFEGLSPELRKKMIRSGREWTQSGGTRPEDLAVALKTNFSEMPLSDEQWQKCADEVQKAISTGVTRFNPLKQILR